MRYLIFLLFLLPGLSFSANAQIATASGRPIKKSEMDRFIKTEMDSLQMPGMSIAVIKHGRVVYHRVFGVANAVTRQPVDEQSIFEAASLSKTLFTYFVMKEVEKHTIELDKPLYEYLPFPDIAYDDRYKLITARMVLSHSSGLPNWRFLDLADSSLHIKKGTLYLKFTPGTGFNYSGEGYVYLSKVIAKQEHLEMNQLDSLFQQEVAIPLGLKHTAYAWNAYIQAHKVSGHVKGNKPIGNGKWPSRDSTQFGAAGSLHTEAMDYSKLLIALMDERGLSKASFDEMFRQQVAVPPTNKFADDGTTGWGLGISLKQTPYGIRYKHEGNNNNFQTGYMFFRPQKMGYVFFTNCDKGREFNKRLEKFLLN
jgi:CubicO group peptidase (beta-lactamase class C family)